LWGELAYQLGGKALYERVRSNDEGQRVPQGLFFEIPQAASPCLILLDELADYCVGAFGDRAEHERYSNPMGEGRQQTMASGPAITHSRWNSLPPLKTQPLPEVPQA
jgi:hypothetical protein